MNRVLLDHAGYWVLRAVMKLLHALPYESAVNVGAWIGRIVFYFSNRRRVAYADLKAALGPAISEQERWSIIRKHYRHLGCMFAEVLCTPQLSVDKVRHYVQFHRKDFDAAVAAGKGAIFLTGHFGNWELIQIVPALHGHPINVLAREQKMLKHNELLNQMRELHGSTAVRRGMGTRDLFRALKRGELVGMLGDQSAGRQDGLILRFFGRKTTVPFGPFKIAQRTSSPVLPSFLVRRGSTAYHDLFILPSAVVTDAMTPEQAAQAQLENYLESLEAFVRKHPEQWLWETKRWKYTWTKRILILTDGKPGHEKQSLAVAQQFAAITEQYGRPGMEYPLETIQVEFKSKIHEKCFYAAAFFLTPFVQGHLRWLRAFLTPACFTQILNVSTDFVISAGSSLIPLNLWVARDSNAKSILLMKPGFPYSLCRFDLTIVPKHDSGWVPSNALRLILTPNTISLEDMDLAAAKLAKSIKNVSKIKIALFVGGPTRRYKVEYSAAEKLFSSVSRAAKKYGDYLVTTSRRTPEAIVKMGSERTSRDPACQLYVDASRDKRAEVAPGMMRLAEILIITEDSISMISEAVSAGKKVIVMGVGSSGLPRKHRRFREILEQAAAVAYAAPEDLEKKIEWLLNSSGPDLVNQERLELRERVRRIL